MRFSNKTNSFLLCFSFLFTLLSSLQAQMPTLEWVRSTGGTGSDDGNAVIVDALGNAYCAGYHQAAADLDPGPATFAATGPGIHLQKFDPAGNLIWAINYPSTGQFYVYDMALDGNNHLVLVGTFTGTIDFDPGAGVSNLTAQGSKDMFLLKLTDAGAYVFANAALSGAGADEIPKGVVVDAQGRIGVAGWFEGAVDFDPGAGTTILNSAGGSDAFLAQYDANGNFLWAHRWGAGNTDSAWDLSVDNSGNLTAVGRFSASVDFDPGPGAASLVAVGTFDGFICRLDAGGNFVWAKQIAPGANQQCTVMAINTDPQGNLVLGGIFFGSVDLDPGPGTQTTATNGTYDMFVLKTDPNASYRWSYGIGGFTGDGLYSVATDAHSNVYLAGTFVGTVDFDPGPALDTATSLPYFNIAVLKYDSAGNYGWSAVAGGADNDFVRQMQVSPQNDVYVTGAYLFSADFAPDTAVYTLNSVAGADAFLYKLHVCQDPPTTVLNESACLNFTLNGTTYSTSGTYTQVLPSSQGCDSTVVLNLIITPVQASVQANGGTLTAFPSAANYQWLDCDNGFSPVGGAFSQVFTPVVPGNYAVAVDMNVCADTSTCVNVSTVDVQSAAQPACVLQPNPATTQIMLKAAFAYGDLSIVNGIGQVVWEAKSRLVEEFWVDVKDWPKGMYFLRMERVGAALRLVVE
jgi:hypothetical protein